MKSGGNSKMGKLDEYNVLSGVYTRQHHHHMVNIFLPITSLRNENVGDLGALEILDMKENCSSFKQSIN